MASLSAFKKLDIDWDMTPEEAVTLYLEWGNNNWHDRHKPIRSKNHYSNYFVVDTWGEEPKVLLIRRNSDGATELASLELPAGLSKSFTIENGDLKGIFEPTPDVKEWLKKELGA